MAILTRERGGEPDIQCVREVRLGAALERRGELERFYVGVIGLRPWPNDEVPGAWGLGRPRRGLLFQFRHDPLVDPYRRRFTLTTGNLDEFERRLAESGVAYQRVRGFFASDDCLTLEDPLGHLVEVRQVRPM